MADINITPEQERRLLEALERADSGAGLAVPGEPIAGNEFCSLWPTVRGVLKFLIALPIIPKKYRDILEKALQYGEAAYGALCGGH